MAVNEIPLPGVTEVGLQRDKEILYSTEGLVQKGRTFAQNATAGPDSDGILPSGTVVGRLASGKWGPYNDSDSNAANEVQTVTVGGSGLESFTLTFSGQTTESLADDASAADVQAALEALSNIGEGNVTVTGSAGGPWTVTFGGDLANTDVAQMTSTPTGGTGSVTVTTATPGTPGGVNVARGVLRNAIDVSAGDILGNVVLGGVLKRDQLIGLDANALADLNGREDTVDNYVKF